MIINEKQIMQLMNFVACLCALWGRQGSNDHDLIEASSLLIDINNQQSEELKDITNETQI